MKPRPVTVALLVLLILAMVAVPALIIANYVGEQVHTDQRITRLERRVDRLETDVSYLRD